MSRPALLSCFLIGSALFAAPAMAQRQPAPISQGITSGELAMTNEELRIANAQTGARLTDLEAEKAQLTGRVETLEFLLAQSREQINQMQEDDAEIARLIAALEAKIDAQAEQLATLSSGSEGIGNGLTTGPRPLDLAIAEVGDDNPLNLPETTGPIPLSPPGDSGSSVLDQARERGGLQEGLPEGTLGTLPASALPGEAGPLFAEAKSRLLRFDYAGAEAAFRAFLTEFGDDPQAGEAQYWLGESLYQQESYDASGQAYTQMIRDYPDDPRAPEALAKLARSLRLIGDTEKACAALNLLPKRYPEASGVTKNLAAGERLRAGCDG